MMMDFSNDQQITSDGTFENFSEDNVKAEETGNNGQPEGDISTGSDGKVPPVDDDAADDCRKIFVGGIHHEASEKDLVDYFNQYGKVRKCIIKVDKYTGHSRGFGFVVFDEEDSVQKTLDQPDHKLKNKKIEPKRAKPSREPQKKIFVGGIDPEVTEEQIKEYFGRFGKIESLDLPFDSHRQKRKAYIFVGYSAEAEARKACENEKQDIYGKRCDVRIAVQKEQLQKQKGPWGNWHQQGYPAAYGNYQGYAGYDQSYGYPGYENYGPTYSYGPPPPAYGPPSYSNPPGNYEYSGYGGYGYDYTYSYGHGGYTGSGARGSYGGGGKMGRGRGGNSAANTGATNTTGGYHPYNR